MLKDLARSPDWLNANHLTKEKVETSRFNNEERILRFFAFYYDLDRYKGKLALPLQRNFHRRMNDEQKLIRTFVVERTD